MNCYDVKVKLKNEYATKCQYIKADTPANAKLKVYAEMSDKGYTSDDIESITASLTGTWESFERDMNRTWQSD